MNEKTNVFFGFLGYVSLEITRLIKQEAIALPIEFESFEICCRSRRNELE